MAIEHHNTGGEPAALDFAPIARRQLFAIMRPGPPTPDDIMDGHDHSTVLASD